MSALTCPTITARVQDTCLRFHSYPLITLSTRAQVESKRAQTSTLDAARRIMQREGIQGLYAGLESALFGISVTNFVYYYCRSPQVVHLSALLTSPVERVRMDQGVV